MSSVVMENIKSKAKTIENGIIGNYWRVFEPKKLMVQKSQIV